MTNLFLQGDSHQKYYNFKEKLFESLDITAEKMSYDIENEYQEVDSWLKKMDKFVQN